MKKLLTILAVGLVAGVTAFAALPTFRSFSGYGNAAAPATVFCPEDPNSQVRVIYVSYGSDTNIAQINFSSGGTAYYVTTTNQAATSTTNLLNSTNGLAPSGVLVLQHGGTCYSATIASWFSNTNAAPYGGTGVVLGANGWNVATSPGDEVELMQTALPIPVYATTNVLSGDAVFTGNYGRIVEVQFSSCLTTDRLYSVQTHYDSQSQ